MDNGIKTSTAAALVHAGLATAQIRANHASPKKVRSAPTLSELEEAKRTLALTENSVWVTTGIPTVRSVPSTMDGKPVTRFRVHMRKYSRDTTSKGRELRSPMYESRHDAEAAIFETRYNFESPTSKKHVDSFLMSLETGEDMPVVPELKKRRLSKNASKARAATMTQHPAVRNSLDAPPNMNPKVPGPFNRYNEVERNQAQPTSDSAASIV